MKKSLFAIIALFLIAFTSCVDDHQDVTLSITINQDITVIETCDLGLSVKWANKNVGAKEVTDFGNYYAWGETKPQSQQDGYTWSTYKWCEGTKYSLTKYCTNSEYGKVDNKKVLEPEDDAATVNSGSAWRMPTSKEMSELHNNCFWIWTDSYNDSNVAGYIVYKAKKESDKGITIGKDEKVPENDYTLSDVHIFMPAAGLLSDSKIHSEGKTAYYWVSDLGLTHNEEDAVGNDRYQGLSVRAVYNK